MASGSILNTTRNHVGEADEAEQVNNTRTLVASNMNFETLVCKFDGFFKHYGPPEEGMLLPDDVESCTTVLLDAGLLVRTTGGIAWRDYQAPPSTAKEDDSEAKVYEPLGKIIDTIFSYASSRRRNDFVYKRLPYARLGSDIGALNHKMTACIVENLKHDCGAAREFGGIIPIELSQFGDAVSQIKVRQKIVGDCHHIMSKDPRRKFMFAVTFEDARLSVWYFSRSHSVKARSFNWTCNEHSGIDKFIRVFLTFALATPADLGMDPYVRRAQIADAGAAQQYIYMCSRTPQELAKLATSGTHHTQLAASASEVMSQTTDTEQGDKYRYFKTVDSISSAHSYRISGRMSRIWKVVEVKSLHDDTPLTGQVLVLKDSWADKGRPTEAENLDLLFQDVELLLTRAKDKYAGDEDWLGRSVSEDKRFAEFDQPAKDRLQALLTKEGYKGLFLTKVVAWKGAVTKAVSARARHSPRGIFADPDLVDTQDPARHVTEMGPRYFVRPPDGEEERTALNAAHTSNPRFSHQYIAGQQSRVVYEEVCTELHNLGTLGKFMDVMNQALTALQVMYCAGWVHRDISSGNILAFDEGEGVFKVKLCDLEFAEKLIHDGHHSDRFPGTPSFMPHEIMHKKYLLDRLRRNRVRPELSMASDLKLKTGTPEFERYKQFLKYPDGFTAIPENATDDIPVKGATPCYNYQHDLESLWWLVLYFISRGVHHNASRDYAKAVFNKSPLGSTQRSETFLQDLSWGADHLHPLLVGDFLDMMEALCSELHRGYVKLEVFGLLKQDDAYSAIHGTFARMFRELLEKDGKWKNLPLVDASNALNLPIKFKSAVAGSKHCLSDSDSDESGTHTSFNIKRIKIEEPESSD